MHEGAPPELARYRSSIDEIDRRLLELCRQRFEICLQVADFKKKHDIPMMQPERPGSTSQRNAGRCGFHIAYTRTKWRLPRRAG